MKKVFVTSMALALAMSLIVTACSSNSENGSQNTAKPTDTGKQASETPKTKVNATGFPISNENIQLTIMVKKAANQGAWQDLWISKHLEEKLGGKIVATEVDDASWNEKKNLAFAAGELPDFFMTNNAFTSTDVLNYGQQGQLIRLNELIDKYAPNIKKFLDANPDVKKSITDPKGNIYALPGVNPVKREASIGRYWINKQWLDKLGLKMPTTLDEFYTVLKAFKEKDPNGNGKADEIPASGSTANPLSMIVLSALGLVEGSWNGITLDKTGNKVIYAPQQPEYKEYLIFMNKLFKEGLIDPEYYTQNIQAYRGKAQQGLVGFFFDAAPVLSVGAEKYTDYPSFPPLTSPQNNTKMWPVQRIVTLGGLSSMAITSKNKNPEATMRIFDYAYTPEGGMSIRFGPDVGVLRQDAGVVKNSDNTWQFKNPADIDSYTYRSKFVTNMSLTYTDQFSVNNKEAPDSIFLTQNIVNNQIPYGKPIYPNVFLTAAETEKVNKIQTDLKTYAEQLEAKFIYGETPISKWDEYIATLQKIGSKDLIDVYQAAFDRWNK
ncbi:extracellular solute-binding protein [Paenibacillus qinlingensis]|uniref:extracellular solute-binding protein n=1 Tax=Paenibacillus qinlingensis TaxID=1837343 RepID=UPI001563C2E6|nr:extracellular solute-binding protein [Paenibacillus qinlingensis]NQX58375.1 extracellular solute-binding protein [Paenibacillus qinlingensis]